MINIVMYGERHRSVHPIDRATACVNEVPYLVVTAAFQNVGKAHDVTVDVCVGILQRITHARLCSEIDHGIKAVLAKQCLYRWSVLQVTMNEIEGGLRLQAGLSEPP